MKKTECILTVLELSKIEKKKKADMNSKEESIL